MSTGNGSDQESLDFTLKYNPPMGVAAGERALKEAKKILDELGVTFLLSSGTCLGAVRDDALIPWDDDLDLISVIGADGFTEESVDAAVAAFREHGYFVSEMEGGTNRSFSMIKDYVRTGWECYRIVGESVWVYPMTEIPARLFLQPREITFLGERFLVPDPTEEYLRLKYGEEWQTPKRSGAYEIDVVDKVPGAEWSGSPSTLRVLDEEGRPVAGAEVVLVGGGRSETDERGYAEMILPGVDWYALVIRYPGHERVLYMEQLQPDKAYVYRADSASKAAGQAAGPVGTLGNLLTLE
jgi:hypothetical protein